MSRLKRKIKNKKQNRPLATQSDPILAQARHYQDAGDHQASLRCYLEIVKTRPDDPYVLNNIGANYYFMRQFQQALTYFRKTESLGVSDAYTLKMIGLCYTRIEKFTEAENYLSRAYKADRHDFDIINWLIFSLNRNGKPRDVLHIVKALSPQQMTADIYADYMEALITLDRKDEAVRIIEDAVASHPDEMAYYTLLGKAYFEAREQKKSVEAYKRVYEANPNDVNAVSNYALGLTYLCDFETALTLYHSILADHAHDYRIYVNISNVYRMLQDMDKAVEYALVAQKIAPSNASVNYAVGIHAMTAGDYARGWVNTEYFWQINKHNMYRPSVRSLNWYGENLSQKRVTVYADQGVGDTVLFLRYVPMILERYPDCNITIIAEQKLHDVIRSMMGDLTLHLLDKNQVIPASFQTDYVVAASTLPYVFDTRIDTVPPPYRTIQKQRDLNYKDNPDDFVIGISWHTKSSDAGYKRSIALASFKPLADLPNVKIVDLQYGDTADERAACGFDIIHDETVDCWNSLQDHVDQIHACDLVISVDNTTVHVAGAIGKAVWTILPYDCFWRCWHLGHESTPWYPSMRLFRQGAGRDYAPVLDVIKESLDDILADRSRVNDIPVFHPSVFPQTEQSCTLIFNHRFSGAQWTDYLHTDGLMKTLAEPVETLDRQQIINAPAPVPELKDFDNPHYLSAYRFADPNVFDRISRADRIIVDAGHDLNGLGTDVIRLLYLIYVAKTVFRKSVTVIAETCLPEGNFGLTDPHIVAFYRKVLLAVDRFVIRNDQSRYLLEQLQIPCVYDERAYMVRDHKFEPVIILAGLPDITPDMGGAINKIATDYKADGGRTVMVAGGPYFNMVKFRHDEDYLRGFITADVETAIVADCAELDKTMLHSCLCITGDAAVVEYAMTRGIPVIALAKAESPIAAVVAGKPDCMLLDIQDPALASSLILAVGKLLKNN